ncbi:MAG: serine/threonine protein kinase, partial [Pseudomonadota bacterium]|nr:serine/threonine protein kinase [Pseudomonadota bacterium]
QVYASLLGCTVLLLNSIGAVHPMTPEQTMVDGIFKLHHGLVKWRHERTLEVAKFRGSGTLDGSHEMQISAAGITVFPRLEAARVNEVPRLSKGAALTTGVPGSDALIGAGGFPLATVTAVAGAPGSGKTLLGLHFVGQATDKEPALLFGFYESPALLVEIARSFGIDLDGLCKSKALEILWQPYGALQLDELGYRLLRAVERTQCKRLFIDGLGGFMSARAFEERGPAFLATLSNELRRLGTTTLFAVESDDTEGFVVSMTAHNISAIADNVIRLRTEESDGRMRRSVSIGKVRGSRIELSLRELTLSDAGLRVADQATQGASG